MLQIEAFARALGRLLEMKNGPGGEPVKAFIKATYNEMKIDRSLLMNGNHELLVDFLRNKNEQFRDVLIQFLAEDIAVETDETCKYHLLQTAFFLIDWNEKNTTTFCFEKQALYMRLKKSLSAHIK